jgi:hypothetical protein
MEIIWDSDLILIQIVDKSKEEFVQELLFSHDTVKKILKGFKIQLRTIDGTIGDCITDLVESQFKNKDKTLSFQTIPSSTLVGTK